jgi:hypothetical protein
MLRSHDEDFIGSGSTLPPIRLRGFCNSFECDTFVAPPCDGGDVIRLVDHSGRACRARGGHPRADGGGRKRIKVRNTPAARLIARGEECLLLLDELKPSCGRASVVDACRLVAGFGLA